MAALEVSPRRVFGGAIANLATYAPGAVWYGL